MTDVVSKLRRASEQLMPPERAFERMVERRERKRRIQRVASGVLALVLAIAVIGGTFVALSGLSGDPVQPANEGNDRAVDPTRGVSPLQACVEAAGYNWDEVYPVWDSPEHPPAGSVFADREFWDAWAACRVETGLAEQFSEERIASENHEVMKYMRCMRQRGWELPDPEPSDSPYHPGLLDPPIDSIPEHPKAAIRFYSDSADCGFPFYDEHDNLLPLEG